MFNSVIPRSDTTAAQSKF